MLTRSALGAPFKLELISSCVILTLAIVALNCVLCLQQQQQQQPHRQQHVPTQQQQQQLAQALDKQHQQQLQQQVVAIQQSQSQQQHQHQQQVAGPSQASANGAQVVPKGPKSKLVNKIKDARHRRRHRHQRRRQNQQQAAAVAAMAAAAAAEPAVQAASSTALIALESIVEEVARAGAQLPLAAANALQQQQQQQFHQQQQQQTQQRQQTQEQQQQQVSSTSAQPTSQAVSGPDLLLEGSQSPSTTSPAGQQQQQQQQQQVPTGANSNQHALTRAPSQVNSVPQQQQQPALNGPTVQLPVQHATRGPLHNTRGFLLTTTLSKIYNLLNVTEFALEMRDGISSRASCVACNAVVGLFLSPLYSKEVFSAAIRTVCVSFRIQSARVCHGLVESFQDDFEYIRKNTKLTRDEVCGVVFGVDCARRQTYNLFWTVPIPEMPLSHPNHPNNRPLTQNIHKPLVIGGGENNDQSSSSIPLDEHSLTSMEDAPDLFEYRKSNVNAAASAPSQTTVSLVQQDNNSKQHQNNNINNQQQQDKQAPAAAAAKEQQVGNVNAHQEQQVSQAGSSQSQAATTTTTTTTTKKAPKMLKRPQYIFDDERQLPDGNDPTTIPASSSSNTNGLTLAGVDPSQRSTFVHITDIHIDPYYEAGSLNECNEPLCCRATSGPPSADKRRQAGRWGDYGNCDVPVRTLRNALNRIREQHSDAEYWLWTGDISPHDIWNITKAEAANHVRLVTKLVRTYSNGLPVFPVIGNHEAHPVNSFSPPEIKGKFSMSWLYDVLADEWADWLPEDALKTLRVGGYYKLQIRRGFRILALNTNYCARLNPWSFYDPVDPANQLKWLAEELLEAELNQDKVHIIGHVPPDNRECTQAWLFNFINIVDRFRDTIAAQFYGHTHRDEWRVIYSLARPDEPIGVQYIGPSITPFTENNPAYRIYHQNKQGHILDSETYYFNLTEANETPTSEPKWRFSYSTRAHLNMTSGMSASQWHQYLQKLHDDDDHFENFYKNFYRYSDVKLGQVCKNKCKYQLLSDLRLSHPYKTKPKPFLANRKTSNHHHRDRHDRHDRHDHHHHHHHHRRLRSHQE